MRQRSFVRRGDARSFALHPSAMRATYTKRDVPACCVDDGVGILCIEGPLDSKPGMWFDNYERILGAFKDMLCDEDVRAILLKIDSPGGDAAGLNECVTAMRRAKVVAGKPVYAYADEGAYSAAYALACAADAIYLPEPGGLGSIGVIVAMMSFVRANEAQGIDLQLVYSGDHKIDGNPDAPLTDAAIEHAQRRVDQLARIYWELVSESRGLRIKEVRALQADTFYGYEAVDVGLADDVMPLEELMTLIRARLDDPMGIAETG